MVSRTLLKGDHIAEVADDVGALGESTWGEMYHNLEKLRLNGIQSLMFSGAFLVGGVILLLTPGWFFGAIALGLSGFYFRDYIGAFGNYKYLYGGRGVVIPNLKVK
jgi:hypothetical protein